MECQDKNNQDLEKIQRVGTHCITTIIGIQGGATVTEEHYAILLKK
jgi:hypothetical protein